MSSWGGGEGISQNTLLRSPPGHAEMAGGRRRGVRVRRENVETRDGITNVRSAYGFSRERRL